MNSVVSWRMRISPSVAAQRAAVAAKCPANTPCSVMRGLLKKRYAALVAASRRYRLTRRGRQLVQQPPQTPPEALVGQARGGEFVVLPAGFAGHRTTAHL